MTHRHQMLIDNKLASCFDSIKRNDSERAHQDFHELISQQEQMTPSQAADFAELCLCFSQPDVAIPLLERVTQSPDALAICHGLLGRCYIAVQRYEDAIRHLETATNSNKSLHNAWMDLGLCLMEIGKHSNAEFALQQALDLAPNHADAHRLMARCAGVLGHSQRSMDHALRAIELKPDSSHLPFLHYVIGRAASELGERDNALIHFHKAIDANPHYGIAWHGLAQIKTFVMADMPFLEKGDALLQDILPTEDRVFIHFALGKAYDDLKDWDRAFTHYQKGNILRMPRFSQTPQYDLFNNYRQSFNKTFILPAMPVTANPVTPVFIIGMPRSGSTLIEQILSAHPLVQGAGELSGIHSISTAICPDTEPDTFQQKLISSAKNGALTRMRDGYLQYLGEKCPHSPYVIDKEPSNYLRIGLIRYLFPNAIIIHSVRHPLDTCLSCFFQPFDSIFWSTDLRSIAREYAFYRSVIDYWRNNIHNANIIDLVYEDLLADPEKVIRQLIMQCGLPWDDRCLAFHLQARTVRTASLAQVREPLYRRSKYRWQHYQHHLSPLIDGLESFLDPSELLFARTNTDEQISWWRKRLQQFFTR